MFIEPVAKGNIVIFRLVNGEVVIGKFVEQSGYFYSVENPRSIYVLENKIALAATMNVPIPFMEFNADKIIYACSDPPPDLMDAYTRSVSTVQVATALPANVSPILQR